MTGKVELYDGGKWRAATPADFGGSSATDADGDPLTDGIAASGVTTVSDAAAVRLPSGVKSWQARVVGTGAVSATVEIQFSNDGTNWMSHADYTITLSGTTSDVDAFTAEDAYAYHRASVTAISGTGAAVTVVVGF
jgi:hypothetical protein